MTGKTSRFHHGRIPGKTALCVASDEGSSLFPVRYGATFCKKKHSINSCFSPADTIRSLTPVP